MSLTLNDGTKIDLMEFWPSDPGKAPVAHGSVAQRMLNNGFNVNSLRNCDVLHYEEWLEVDRVVVDEAQLRLQAVGDLISAGLTVPTKGLGKTVFASQKISDITDAEITMDGATPTDKDRPLISTDYLPLPIIHKDIEISARMLAASRSEGYEPMDTTNIRLATRKVAEKVETILLTGASSYGFGGGAIYGYLDFPNINSGSLTADWDDSTATGSTMLADLLAMKQASIDARHYGPWDVYLPTNYDTAVDDDFKAASDKTIRQRLMEIGGINNIKVADKLTADYIVMVQKTPDVVRLVDGMPLSVVQWDQQGGMVFNYKVMTIMVPQIRSEYSDRCGVTVYS